MIDDSPHQGSPIPTAFLGKAIEYVRRNRVLLYQGQRADAVYYVLSGTLGLSVSVGAKHSTISLLGPGGFAGTECITSVQTKNQWSCRTLADSTLLRIDRAEMLRMIQSQETFAILFLDYLRNRITRYQDMIMNRTFDSHEIRLARTLLMLTNFGGDSSPLVVVPNIGQSVLAELAGTTPARVTFFMNRFKHLGLISYKKQSPITIQAAALSAWLRNAAQSLPKTQGQIIQWPTRADKWG